MKFNVLCIDPPFSFSDKLDHSEVKRGAEANYGVMSNLDIAALDINSLADPSGAVLALWVPSSLLPFGLELMEKYGFSFKQTWIWNKIKKDPFAKLKKELKKDKKIDWDKVNFDDFLSFGMGRIGRNVHEIALIGTKGKIYNKVKNKSQRTVFFHYNEKHSKKPELLQDKLDLIFPDTDDYKLGRIEIFSRRQRDGWVCLGNDSPMTKNEDIKESLNKIENISDEKMFSINKIISTYDEGKKEELFKMWSELPG